MQTRRKLIAAVICAVLSIVLFLVFHYIGNQSRPVPAVGGELLIALLPGIIYYILYPILRDIFYDLN